MSNKMWIGTELYNGSFGKFYTQNDLDKILSYAIDIGANKIDTAECYNMEKMIGNSLKNKKNKFKIASKFGHEINGRKKISNFSLKSVKRQLECSLKSLNVNHIDLYYFYTVLSIIYPKYYSYGALERLR